MRPSERSLAVKHDEAETSCQCFSRWHERPTSNRRIGGSTRLRSAGRSQNAGGIAAGNAHRERDREHQCQYHGAQQAASVSDLALEAAQVVVELLAHPKQIRHRAAFNVAELVRGRGLLC